MQVVWVCIRNKQQISWEVNKLRAESKSKQSVPCIPPKQPHRHYTTSGKPRQYIIWPAETSRSKAKDEAWRPGSLWVTGLIYHAKVRDRGSLGNTIHNLPLRWIRTAKTAQPPTPQRRTSLGQKEYIKTFGSGKIVFLWRGSWTKRRDEWISSLHACSGEKFAARRNRQAICCCSSYSYFPWYAMVFNCQYIYSREVDAQFRPYKIKDCSAGHKKKARK